jgi:hypothetical protein
MLEYFQVNQQHMDKVDWLDELYLLMAEVRDNQAILNFVPKKKYHGKERSE